MTNKDVGQRVLQDAAKYLEQQAQSAWELQEIIALTWALNILVTAFYELRGEENVPGTQ
jgi:hypothetical protein